MKLTKSHLKKIIKEELQNALQSEGDEFDLKGAAAPTNIQVGDEVVEKGFGVKAYLREKKPEEFKALKKRGLLDRFIAAAKAADEKEGKLLKPSRGG